MIVNMESVREFRDRKVFLTSKIEGGNANNFKKYPGDIYSFMPQRDSGENYSSQAYYFKFQIENLLNDLTHITVTAIAEYDDTWKGWQYSIHPTLWIFSPNNQKFPERIHSDRVRTTPQSMSINLILQPFEKIIITNMLTPPYSQLLEEIELLASHYPTLLKLTQIGQSPMGNPLYSIKVNPNATHTNQVKILVGGSPQSNEFGDLAVIFILQEFLNKGTDYWDEFNSRFTLECILFQNSDGMVLGTNMVNSKGENTFFSYFADFHLMPEENKVVWEHIQKEPPDIYLEMHSFFQDNKTLRPYIYPMELLPEKDRQKTYQKIAKSLINLCNGMKESIHKNQPYFQDTLCYRLMERYHTLSFQFKLHSGMSISESKKTAWEVFHNIVRLIKAI